MQAKSLADKPDAQLPFPNSFLSHQACSRRTWVSKQARYHATAFNNVATALYDKLQEGKVHFISRARVNIAKKQFRHLSNKY
ncbi:hypothetical protein B0H13DRAFT_2078932, partial [Mycena leptocephala]